MLSRSLKISLLLSIALCSFNSVQAEESSTTVTTTTTSSSTTTTSPTLAEMEGHRHKMRDDLMTPSLKGIRGISFGIPGHYGDASAEQTALNKLKQLPVPVSKIIDLKHGETKPVDAILQVKVLETGTDSRLVELSLVQWCKLSRNGQEVKSVTYSDQTVTHKTTVNDTIGKMVNQFVLDFMKANHHQTTVTEGKSNKKS
ncbi:hypothetical protein KA183_01485 [bacterium]|nr:hypothetical protein [bacterium]QQR59043.1 MAG: hypothetical protein IPG59_06000 [Candidatus Melainabacteria bacterium]